MLKRAVCKGSHCHNCDAFQPQILIEVDDSVVVRFTLSMWLHDHSITPSHAKVATVSNPGLTNCKRVVVLNCDRL